MRDSWQRTIDYLRISVTDRCNLRCVYCMPEDGVVKQDHADILSFEDTVRIARVLAGMGIRTVKITGGEPLARKGVADLIRGIKAIPGIERVTMTSNGILLPPAVPALRAAGLDSVTVSLDAFDPRAYAALTRGGDVRLALAGLDAALAGGFRPVKVNCVPFVDTPPEEIRAIASLAQSRPIHVRFIQLMPMGEGSAFQPMPRPHVDAILRNAFGSMEPTAGPGGTGPARYVSLAGFVGTLGFIDTLDHGICSRCNRLRLTADGMLKTCLHMDRGVSLKPALALQGDDALALAIANAVRTKPPHHAFADRPAGAEQRAMSQIGG